MVLLFANFQENVDRSLLMKLNILFNHFVYFQTKKKQTIMFDQLKLKIICEVASQFAALYDNFMQLNK